MMSRSKGGGGLYGFFISNELCIVNEKVIDLHKNVFNSKFNSEKHSLIDKHN